MAYIHPNGKKVHLGSFPDTKAGKICAARAYNKAALTHFGEYAQLNPM
jgi:hypothetical protein